MRDRYDVLFTTFLLGLFLCQPGAVADSLTGSGGARITQITAYDEGQLGSEGEGTYSVDVVKHSCPSGSPLEEPFHDTLVGLTVTNTSSFIVRFDKFKYKVLGGKKRRVKSRKLALAGIGEVAPLETGEVYAFLLDVDGDGKRFVGSRKSVEEQVSLGIKNIRFTLFGTTSGGSRIRLSSRIALSFDDVERCD